MPKIPGRYFFTPEFIRAESMIPKVVASTVVPVQSPYAPILPFQPRAEGKKMPEQTPVKEVTDTALIWEIARWRPHSAPALRTVAIHYWAKYAKANGDELSRLRKELAKYDNFDRLASEVCKELARRPGESDDQLRLRAVNATLDWAEVLFAVTYELEFGLGEVATLKALYEEASCAVGGGPEACFGPRARVECFIAMARRDALKSLYDLSVIAQGDGVPPAAPAQTRADSARQSGGPKRKSSIAH